MSEKDFRNMLIQLLQENEDEVIVFTGNYIERIETFEESMMLTKDEGFVITLEEGQMFEITVKKVN